MSLNRELVKEAMKGVRVSPQSPDVVAANQFAWAAACDTYASVKLRVGALDKPGFDRVAGEAHKALLALGKPLDSLIVEFIDDLGTVIHTTRFGGPVARSKNATPAAPQAAPAAAPVTPPSRPAQDAGHRPIGGVNADASGIQGVGRIIAVGAGKGGVGKSTIALNLAVGLARRGKSVGLMDGDIYGPSMPTMLGLGSLDPVIHEGLLQPFAVHGVKCMTIGKLVDPEKPLIWRGPMAHGAFKQLTEQTRWGELDYLIVDLPPGTGDVSLTLAQALKVAGAVVVCTPQKVAQDDAVRAAKMFQQLGIEVLGVVENMSSFVADDGKSYEIFGRGGAEQMAQRLGVPFLGAIPITMGLRVNSDTGNPTLNFTPTDAPGKRLYAALEAMIDQFEAQASLAAMRAGATRPTLTIS